MTIPDKTNSKDQTYVRYDRKRNSLIVDCVKIFTILNYNSNMAEKTVVLRLFKEEIK